MSLQVYLAFVAACIALALLPGPMVTLVIANGLRHGTRAALTNIAGAQLGLGIVIGIVAVGLTSLMATMGYWFDWVRFAGAAYLVWLGVRLIRAPGQAIDAEVAPPASPRGGFLLQGLLVMLSNPKVLVFFGAFIPQFVDMEKDHFPRWHCSASPSWSPVRSPILSTRCWPVAPVTSSRRGAQDCCRGSPVAS